MGPRCTNIGPHIQPINVLLIGSEDSEPWDPGVSQQWAPAPQILVHIYSPLMFCSMAVLCHISYSLINHYHIYELQLRSIQSCNLSFSINLSNLNITKWIRKVCSPIVVFNYIIFSILIDQLF